MDLVSLFWKAVNYWLVNLIDAGFLKTKSHGFILILPNTSVMFGG